MALSELRESNNFAHSGQPLDDWGLFMFNKLKKIIVEYLCWTGKHNLLAADDVFLEIVIAGEFTDKIRLFYSKCLL